MGKEIKRFSLRLPELHHIEWRPYCPAGQTIMEDPKQGPASKAFSNHVKRCGQCSEALEAERPDTKH